MIIYSAFRVSLSVIVTIELLSKMSFVVFFQKIKRFSNWKEEKKGENEKEYKNWDERREVKKTIKPTLNARHVAVMHQSCAYSNPHNEMG